MSQSNSDEYFVDLVTSIAHANGVFRIGLGQQGENNATEQTVRLLIPVSQMQSILRAIADGGNEIREKIQTARAEQEATEGSQGAGDGNTANPEM